MKVMSLERVKELVSYDPETGFFTSRVSRGPARAGGQVGSKNDQGYILLSLDLGRFKASRVAWAIMTGEWPEVTVDHKNRKRDDNRWDNLRLATKRQNAANCVKLCSDLPKGVTLKGKKFRSSIRNLDKMEHLGTFETAEEAHKVFVKRHIELHGEFSPLIGGLNETK